MRLFTTSVLSSLPLLALARLHDRSRLAQHARGAPHSHNGTRSQYALQDMFTGESFLNDWDFFTGEDPTHGNVNYQSKADAVSKNLAYVQSDGTTVLAVDDTNAVPVGGNRDSVRITSKATYNGGLFIADIWSMPHGCSTWPAYWSVGPNWPQGGEIDVVEGVHNQATNQYTLHTSGNCSLSTNDAKVEASILTQQCASSNGDNTGCGFLDSDTRSYGHGFNMIAGGVYAHLWNGNGIKVWHFARGEIPQDIEDKTPNPANWGTPAAFWSSSACDSSHFFQHSLVIDTTICGDWAGASYASAGCPGTCAEAVADPSNFQLAKWKLNYIAVYQPAT